MPTATKTKKHAKDWRRCERKPCRKRSRYLIDRISLHKSFSPKGRIIVCESCKHEIENCGLCRVVIVLDFDAIRREYR